MGYTTEFEGSFRLSAEPPVKVIVALHAAAEDQEYPEGPTPWPSGYCQWELTRDCMGIKWDGSEKFYDYVEYLQAILDNILKPNGLTLTGEVKYRGEDNEDYGVLRIEDGEVIQEDIGVVIGDLRAFKDFVLASNYGAELVEAYQRKKAV